MHRNIGVVSTVFIVVVLLIGGTSTPRSQAAAPTPLVTRAGTPSANCDLSSLFKTAGVLKSTSDSAKDLTALLDFARNIQDANIACNGHQFKGSGNFSSDVFDFKPGVYKVTVNEPGLTEDNLVSVEMLSVNTDNKNCLDQYMFQDNLKPDKDTISASNKYDAFGGVKSCRVTMTVDASSDWTLTFTPLQ